MGNHLFGLPSAIIEPTSVTAVSEAAGREAENVLTATRPNRLFMGSGTWSSETLVFDLGATTQLEGVFVDNINTIGITVEGHATNSWGAPSYGASVTHPVPLPWGREKFFLDLRSTTWDSTGYRYLRIRAFAGSTSDGSSVWKVGGVTLITSILELDTNFGFPFDETVVEPVDVQPRVGAPPEVSILGPKRFQLALNQPTATDSAEPDWREILNVGQGRHLVYYRNNDSLREAYMLRQVTPTPLSTTGVRTRSLQNLIFEEVA